MSVFHALIIALSGTAAGIFTPLLFVSPPIPYPTILECIIGIGIGTGGLILITVVSSRVADRWGEIAAYRLDRTICFFIVPLFLTVLAISNSIIGIRVLNWMFLVYLLIVGLALAAVSLLRYARKFPSPASALWLAPLFLFMVGPVAVIKTCSVRVAPNNPKANLSILKTASPQSAAGTKNVVFILIDTLRPDHLSSYGYMRQTSPNIDALAKGGVLFKNAFSQASWSTSAVSSIFTSLYPNQHGSVDFGTLRLHDSFLTIAEAFKEGGFVTAGISSNPLVSIEAAFDQGFDYFDEYCAEQMNYRSTDCVYDKAWTALNLLNGKKPFFLYLHFFDPHFPYLAPKPFRGTFDSVTAPHHGPIRSLLINGYDDEILYVDDAVGKIMAELKRHGLYEDTIVVLTSDHGEELRERGRFSHGHTVFDEVIHVPLIFAGPGLPVGKSISALIESIDIYPTLLELAGVKLKSAPDLSGTSLMPLISGETDQIHSEIFSSVFEEVTIRGLRYKMIMDTVHNKIMLFDLKLDPGEESNIIGLHKDLAAEWSRRLEEKLEEISLKAPPVKTGIGQLEELKDRLRALNYANQ